MTQLDSIADNLVLLRPGFWTARGHEDLKFIESDRTDWLSIEQASFWYRHRNRVFLSLIERYPPGGPIFEVGAGNGAVTLALQQAGYAIVGIEPTVRMAENASRRGVQTIICATLQDAGFKPQSLRNVALFDVLEHIDVDGEYLARVRSLMPAGGLLYCAVPAWTLLWSREDEEAGHVRRYTLKTLGKVLTHAGFSMQFSTYYFGPLVLPIMLARTLPSWLGIRRRRTPESSRREHDLNHSFVGRGLQHLLDREALVLAKGKPLVAGASCFVVARAE
jgi:SAM-dependent methyltransferase